MNSQSLRAQRTHDNNDELIILAQEMLRANKTMSAALEKFIKRRTKRLARQENIQAAYSNAYHRSMNKQS